MCFEVWCFLLVCGILGLKLPRVVVVDVKSVNEIESGSGYRLGVGSKGNSRMVLE